MIDNTTKKTPRWLEWARELQTMAQTGLTYAKDPYDIERYRRLREIASEIIASHSDSSAQQIHDIFADQAGHATPKVDVRAAVFRDDTILLVRERSDGKWTLPGGWADPGESPRQAILREVFEESGYNVQTNRLLALYDRDRHPHPPLPFAVYKLFFDCTIVDGAPAASLETDGVAFFSEGALPDLSLPRVLPQQIQRLFVLHRQPDLGPEFD